MPQRKPLTPALALDLVDNLLCVSNQRQAEALCHDDPFFGEIYQIFTSKIHSKTICGKDSRLIKTPPKPYIEVLTNSSDLSSFIIYERNNKSLIDLGASIGYNRVSLDQLNMLEITEASNVRLSVSHLPPNSEANFIEAHLPNDPGRLHLSYDPLSTVGQVLQDHEQPLSTLKITASLRLDDTQSPPAYVLTNIIQNSWLPPQ